MSNIWNQIAYGFSAVRKRGIMFVYRYFVDSIWFDLRHGTSTASRVPKDKQNIDLDQGEAGNGLLYVASLTSIVRRSLKCAENVLGKQNFCEALFLDLGCGKGKALLVYSLEYDRAIVHAPVGIEYDPDLALTAQQNVQKIKKLKKPPHIHADSATNLMRYLNSGVAVVYLYNSFQGQTLIDVLTVLQNVPHVLIYVDPAEREVLADFDYKIQFDEQGRYNADTWLLASHGI